MPIYLNDDKKSSIDFRLKVIQNSSNLNIEITIPVGPYQGKYKATNPEKYIGNPDNIVYRSSWELQLMRRFDTDPGVSRWASEEFAIPYYSPLDKRQHRYYPDFYVENVNGEKFVIEVKPLAQTQLPEKPSKTTAKFIAETRTYIVNNAKWKAAETFCKEKGWQFKILTEKDLPYKS